MRKKKRFFFHLFFSLSLSFSFPSRSPLPLSGPSAYQPHVRPGPPTSAAALALAQQQAAMQQQQQQQQANAQAQALPPSLAQLTASLTAPAPVGPSSLHSAGVSPAARGVLTRGGVVAGAPGALGVGAASSLSTQASLLSSGGAVSSAPEPQLSFDMSSFPALTVSAGGDSIGRDSAPEINLAGDDFPALGGGAAGAANIGSPAGGRRRGASGGGAAAQPKADMYAQLTRQQQQQAAAAAQQQQQQQQQQLQQQQQQQQQQQFQQQAAAQAAHQQLQLQQQLAGGANGGAVAAQGGNDDEAAHKYSLLGLLSVIRMADPDRNQLALGTDLTTLGLNLNAPDSLYKSFVSPFRGAGSGGSSGKDVRLPQCYYMQPPMKPAHTKIGSFSDDVLFYMFYSMPRDALQLHAASELYKREWRYHTELQLWFKRVPGVEAQVQAGVQERGSYFFFDTTLWEKVRNDQFIVRYDAISVQPPPPAPVSSSSAPATSAAAPSNSS
jgi:CCR4-NOT transcription complex subunit 2